MSETKTGRNLWSKKLFLRMLVGYLLVPWLPSVLMMAWAARGRVPLEDWLGIGVIYEVVGLAAMLGLGTPLLFCYLRLGWTGFLPFMAAGGLCAGITSYAFLRHDRDLFMVGFFTVSGLVCGLFFRAVLFGFRRYPSVARSV